MRSLLCSVILSSLLLNCSAARADETPRARADETPRFRPYGDEQAPTPASSWNTKDALVAFAKDPTNAKAALSRLAESGDPKMIAALGVMFFDGVGVAINHPEAMPYLRKAAALNRPEAQYRLGLAYYKWNPAAGGRNYYSDPPYDPALAEEWFRKAANSAQASLSGDDPAAMTTLGHLYEGGLGGVDIGGVKQDEAAALRMYLAAAKQGYPDAEVAYAELQQRQLAVRRIKEHSELFTPENLAESFGWFLKAAKSGSAAGLTGWVLHICAFTSPGRQFLTIAIGRKRVPF